MCYEKPGPRCSGHTRTNYRKTKAALEAAKKDVIEKKAALDAAATAEAKAELQNSERLLALAKKAHTVASENYEESKAKRAVAMEAYKKATEEFLTSPAGIKALRKKGEHDKADEALAARKAQMDAYKAEKSSDKSGPDEPEFPAMEPMSGEWQKQVDSHLSKLNESDAWTRNVNKSKAFQNIKNFVWYKDVPDAGMHQIATGVTKYRDELLEVMTISKKLPAETVDYVARNSSIGSFRYADHPNIAPSTSDYLASKGDTNVFKNKALSPDQLTRYSKSEHSNIRGYVALYENTPERLRTKLAADPDEFVRHCVARTTRNKKVLAALAVDSAAQVRESVAENSATESHALELIAGNCDNFTSYNLIRHRNITSKALDKIVQTDDVEVRSRVAKHPRATVELQKQLAQDSSYEVRLALTENKALDQETLEALRKDKSKKVRDALARR